MPSHSPHATQEPGTASPAFDLVTQLRYLEHWVETLAPLLDQAAAFRRAATAATAAADEASLRSEVRRACDALAEIAAIMESADDRDWAATGSDARDMSADAGVPLPR